MNAGGIQSIYGQGRHEHKVIIRMHGTMRTIRPYFILYRGIDMLQSADMNGSISIGYHGGRQDERFHRERLLIGWNAPVQVMTKRKRIMYSRGCRGGAYLFYKIAAPLLV